MQADETGIGADFKRVARLWRRLGNAIVDKPFHEVKESVVRISSCRIKDIQLTTR